MLVCSYRLVNVLVYNILYLLLDVQVFSVIPAKAGIQKVFQPPMDSGSPLRYARNDGYRKPWSSKKLDDRVTENEIAKEIVDAALILHKRLGPGLLESVYEVVLAHELKRRGLEVVCSQKVWVVDLIWAQPGFRLSPE